MYRLGRFVPPRVGSSTGNIQTADPIGVAGVPFGLYHAGACSFLKPAMCSSSGQIALRKSDSRARSAEAQAQVIEGTGFKFFRS